MSSVPTLDGLDRAELVPVALEHMLLGMMVTRAMLAQVVMNGGDLDLMNQIAIDEWMGASPTYTRRMRRLMGIEGDDVTAIIKALQLDCGFVHQYMNVAYKVTDDLHAEFWLNHCGALLDVEPHGEERVFGMCHTIEDPVGPVPLTEEVAKLPLARVPNEIPADREPGGMRDYRGPLQPEFKLADLSAGALVGAAREFQVQAHLLVASTELALRAHFDEGVARKIIANAWIGSGWITSERLAAALQLTSRDATGLARVLSLQAAFPPGFDRTVEVDGDDVRITLAPLTPDLLSTDHPGWLGLLASGDVRGIEAMASGFDARARVHDVDVAADGVTFRVHIDPDRPKATEPDPVALTRIGMVSTWHFDVSDPVRMSRT
jgi:hypothetical protein